MAFLLCTESINQLVPKEATWIILWLKQTLKMWASLDSLKAKLHPLNVNGAVSPQRGALGSSPEKAKHSCGHTNKPKRVIKFNKVFWTRSPHTEIRQQGGLDSTQTPENVPHKQTSVRTNCLAGLGELWGARSAESRRCCSISNSEGLTLTSGDK